MLQQCDKHRMLFAATAAEVLYRIFKTASTLPPQFETKKVFHNFPETKCPHCALLS